MEQMIKRKNELLEEAGEALKEIWYIYRMTRSTECKNDKARETLERLVIERLSSLSYRYEIYLEESKVVPVKATRDHFLDLPTDDEIDAVREVNGDD